MTTNILATLWGDDVKHAFIGSKSLDGPFVQRHVTNADAGLALAAKLSSSGDVYFSPAIYRTSKSREASNVQSLRAFYIDVDCGIDKFNKGTGYASKSEAKNALVGFCNKSGLPIPTQIIDSGNGLHCYWPLDTALPVNIWTEYAQKLKQLMAQHGLRADKSVTADPARLLRVPDTFNYKDPTSPKPVRTKMSGGCLVADVFLKRIDKAYQCADDLVQPELHRNKASDMTVIERIATTVAKERSALWNADWELTETELGVSGYPSHSEGDYALLGCIARNALKSGIAHDQLDRVMAEVFKLSKMYRPEKFNRVMSQDIPHLCNSLLAEAETKSNSKAEKSETNSWLDLSNGTIHLSDSPPAPRDYVVQDLLLAAKSAVLAGQGGVAKSQLLLQIGISVALAMPIFGLKTTAGSVILLMGEEDTEEIFRRINAISNVMRLTDEQKVMLAQRLRVFPLVGADIRLTKSINMSLESSGFGDQIIQAASALENETGLPVRLIGLDHAGLVHGGEFNSREDVVQTMRQVNHIGKTTNAAVLMLAHSPKTTASKETSSSEDIAGNAAWVDLSRAAFVLRTMSDPEGKQLGISSEDRKKYVSMTTVKGNYIPTGNLLWLAKNKVDGYEVSYLSHAKLEASSKPKVGGNHKLRTLILELSAQKLLTKTGIERYSGKTSELKASKGAVKAEVDAMLQDGELILIQPTEEQRQQLGIKGSTSGFLRPTREAK